MKPSTHGRETETAIALDGDAGLRDAWGEFLSRYPWHWFCTLTYARPCSCAEQAVRNFRSFIRDRMLDHALKIGAARIVKRDSLGRPEYRGPLVNAWRRGKCFPVWAAGIEAHRNGNFHTHAVVWFPEPYADIRRDEAWQAWKSKRGLARIEPPTEAMSVSMYVSKYVAKSDPDARRTTNDELHLSPSFKAPKLAVSL